MYKGQVRAEDGNGGYTITEAFVQDMLQEFKEQRVIHRRFAFQILLQARMLLRSLPSLVDVEVPPGRHFTVCGDVHGQYYDLLNIWELNGLPGPDNPYLFNGVCVCVCVRARMRPSQQLSLPVCVCTSHLLPPSTAQPIIPPVSYPHLTLPTKIEV